MSNIALKKLPLEVGIWQRPEDATDGNFLKYDSTNGFASARWPCTYTLDFESEIKISVIRFLLWDNLGGTNTVPHSRKYNFSLSISSDGKKYIDVFSNQGEDGGNGWYSYQFLTGTYARYIKFEGHFNSANDEMHIVEFEVHNTLPPKLTSKNIHEFPIVTGIPSEESISNLIDKVLSTRSDIFKGLESKVATLDDTLLKSEESLQQIELIKQSIDFQRESENNNNRARGWLIFSTLLLVFFLCILLWFVFCDNHSLKIITESATNDAIKPYTTILLTTYYIAKGLLLSTILYILSWGLKNYRSEKHNYVINKHKAMSLTVATGILVKDDYKNTSRGHVFIDAMRLVFTHQATGFSKDETDSPNVVNNLLQKGISDN